MYEGVRENARMSVTSVTKKGQGESANQNVRKKRLKREGQREKIEERGFERNSEREGERVL